MNFVRRKKTGMFVYHDLVIEAKRRKKIGKYLKIISNARMTQSTEMDGQVEYIFSFQKYW